MPKIITYLTFNGNCREAMTFYRECFGGELNIQALGDSPLAKDLPERMKDYILHASLVSDGIELTGTDMVELQGLIRGNAVSLLLECGSEEEARTLYALLSRGGAETYPLEKNHWGALFGGLTDRYGNHWLLNYSGKVIGDW